MSDYYGGELTAKEQWAHNMKWIMFGALFTLFILAILAWANVIQPWWETKSHFSNLGTVYDNAGYAARKNQVLSNAGAERMHNRKDHLVGTNDRLVSWVPGMSNGMPDGWYKEKDDPTKDGVSSMVGSSSKKTGEDQLAAALNSK